MRAVDVSSALRSLLQVVASCGRLAPRAACSDRLPARASGPPLLVVLVVALFAAGLSARAQPAECNGMLSMSYVAGPAFGIEGDRYRVSLALGTGDITGGALNTLSVRNLVFHLDCESTNLPGCTDDGDVIRFDGNVTTSCGNQEPDFWDVSFPDANTVSFKAASPVVIPANQPAPSGFCNLQFDVLIAHRSDAADDETPGRVEQLADMPGAICDNGLGPFQTRFALDLCPEGGRGEAGESPSRTNVLALGPAVPFEEALDGTPFPSPSRMQTPECSAVVNASIISGPYPGCDGSVHRMSVALGSGSIVGGTANIVSVGGVRLQLDCRGAALPECRDDGDVVRYLGNITTTCGTQQPSFWTPVFPDANTVVFRPESPVVIPANQPAPPGFCTIQFDVQIGQSSEARDDTTPNRAEEAIELLEAVCDNGLPGTVTSGAILLCPVCADGNECTVDSCNQATGQCAFSGGPLDSQPCTGTPDLPGDCRAPGCESGVCVATHFANTSEDSQPCTMTADVEGDCAHPGCEAGVCVANHIPDTNEPGCPAPPCTIVAGGVACAEDASTGAGTTACTTDPTTTAAIERAAFRGLVEASTGSIGCGEGAGAIQATWTHERQRAHTTLLADGGTSLLCERQDGVPANVACWSGEGEWSPSHGRRAVRVAFRVEVEDRGEPGGSPGPASTDDVYRLRIWAPTNRCSNANRRCTTSADCAAPGTCDSLAELTVQTCCFIANADLSVRQPNINDGGNLIRGDIQVRSPSGTSDR